MADDIQTEQLILNAARKVFTQKGFAATRMQEIADEAGINRALLHYYFRSKEKLFEKIFTEAIEHIFPNIQNILIQDSSLFEKIERIVSLYIDFAIAHPYLPTFVIHELTQNPEKIPMLINHSKRKPNLEKFVAQILAEVKTGNIRPIEPVHLIVNVISMCLFPFVAKPMMQAMLGVSEKAYKDFITERKKVVTETIVNSIKLPNS